MNVKTFEAFSMKDAVAAVRKEFGADAVILSSKEKVGGDSKGKVYQVTAAAPTSMRKGGASAAETGSDDLREVFGYMRNMEKKIDALSDVICSQEQLTNLESGLEEIKSLVLEALRSQGGSIQENLPEAVQRIYHALKSTGVEEVRLVELMRQLSNVEIPGKLTDQNEIYENYREHAVKWLLKKIKIAPMATDMAGSPSVQVFVGTTGVGKSSTVAKLAAFLHLKKKRKVLLVSFDNVRLAANEQMRIYAKVLGVPFEQIDDPMDLETIIAKYRDIDTVLLDTAGRSPKKALKMDDLSALKNLNIPIEFHLVLPTTEKEEQLDRSIRAFSKLGIASLIFTKMDETWSYGEIFNLTNRWSLPLSYFGVGQNIPEDFERATRERVVERLLGL